MTWAERQSEVNSEIVSAFSEAVTLADGSTRLAIIKAGGDPASAIWDETGLSTRLSDMQKLMLHMLAADAASLADGDAVTVRGVVYQIAHKHQADSRGWVRVDLLDNAVPAGALGGRWQ